MSEAIEMATFVMDEDSCAPAAEEVALDSLRPVDTAAEISSSDASNAFPVATNNFNVTS